MHRRSKHSHKQAHNQDLIWNRAATGGGGPEARDGDLALASLLRLHNETMSSGLLHAVTEGLTRGELDAALTGYRYFGLAQAEVVTESVLADAAHASDQQLDALEAEADRRYALVVSDDATLVQAFAAKLHEAPESFAP